MGLMARFGLGVLGSRPGLGDLRGISIKPDPRICGLGLNLSAERGRLPFLVC